MTRRVYITGIGIISCFGIGKTSFSDALRIADCKIIISKNYPDLSWPVLQAELAPINIVRALEQYVLPSNFSKNMYQLLRRSSLPIQAASLAAVEAWLDHNHYSIEPCNSHEVGVILTGHNLASYEHFQLSNTKHESIQFINPRFALSCMDTHALSVISELLGIQGPGLTIGAASASGNAGIVQGYHWVKQGWVERCLVVGAAARLSPVEMQAFHNLGALGGLSFVDSPAQASRPFDQFHEGFIPGEATACIILESESSALQRGVKRYAELKSAALVLNGTHLPEANLEGEIRVMQQALDEARLSGKDISYINAHGTSTPLGDQVELQAISHVFSGNLDNLWVNSTKSITGHCLWSAGIVEAIATIIQMQQDFLHANRNLDQPLETHCQLVDKVSQPAQIQNALSNSFGFGGINSSIIFSKES